MTDGTAITNTYTVTVDDQTPLGPFATGSEPVMLDEPISGRVVRIDAEEAPAATPVPRKIGIYADG